MNQFFLVTNPEKIPDVLTNCAANNEEVRALLVEMEAIAAQSDSELLKTEMQEYSALILDFIATLETLADAVESGDIEAARAGEAGRGFAVVADDINRTLQHFYNSARQLEDTMENMTNGIEGIATTVNESAEGVTIAAQNTGHLVEALGGIEAEANANKSISELLSGEVSKFKYI